MGCVPSGTWNDHSSQGFGVRQRVARVDDVGDQDDAGGEPADAAAGPLRSSKCFTAASRHSVRDKYQPFT